MKTRSLISVVFFLGIFSSKAMASLFLDFEYVLNGNSVTVKLNKLDPSGLSEDAPCNTTGPYENHIVIAGFRGCKDANTPVTGAEKFNCNSVNRFNPRQTLEQYVQHHGGVGSTFTIQKPSTVSDSNSMCLDFVAESTNASLFPFGAGGMEGVPVPSFVTCSLGSTSLTFAHGNLTSTEVNGNSVSLNLAVTCSDATSVSVVAGPNATSPTGSISLSSDGALVSNISANGVKLTQQGTTIHMPKGMSTISVSSTLQAGGKFNKAGSYSGNGVLVISPQ